MRSLRETESLPKPRSSRNSKARALSLNGETRRPTLWEMSFLTRIPWLTLSCTMSRKPVLPSTSKQPTTWSSEILSNLSSRLVTMLCYHLSSAPSMESLNASDPTRCSWEMCLLNAERTLKRNKERSKHSARISLGRRLLLIGVWRSMSTQSALIPTSCQHLWLSTAMEGPMPVTLISWESCQSKKLRCWRTRAGLSFTLRETMD